MPVARMSPTSLLCSATCYAIIARYYRLTATLLYCRSIAEASAKSLVDQAQAVLAETGGSATSSAVDAAKTLSIHEFYTLVTLYYLCALSVCLTQVAIRTFRCAGMLVQGVLTTMLSETPTGLYEGFGGQV